MTRETMTKALLVNGFFKYHNTNEFLAEESFNSGKSKLVISFKKEIEISISYLISDRFDMPTIIKKFPFDSTVSSILNEIIKIKSELKEVL
jgi:hypothetical protein